MHDHRLISKISNFNALNLFNLVITQVSYTKVPKRTIDE